jgi:hypothetical protein
LSKREALATIMEVVGDNEDLRKGLLDVLSHEQASWSPDDFDQPLAHSPHIIEPDAPYVKLLPSSRENAQLPVSITGAHISRRAVLQPQHQPQVHLPPMLANWYPSQSAILHAANPMQFQLPLSQFPLGRSPLMQYQDSHDTVDHEEYGYTTSDFQGSNGGQDHIYQTYAQDMHSSWSPFDFNGTLSPPPTLPTEAPTTQPYVSPTTGLVTRFPSIETDYCAGYNSPSLGFSIHGHRTSYPASEGFQEGSSLLGWPSAEFHQSHKVLSTLNGNHQAQSASMHYQGPTQRLASSLQSSPGESPSTWGTRLAVPIGQSTSDGMTPPPVKHGSKSYRQPLPLVSTLPSADHQEDKSATTKARKIRAAMGSRKYIHALCGKGFNSRSAVKKHHWGHAKAWDTSTTTGCWAKNDKPDIEWQVHLR